MDDGEQRRRRVRSRHGGPVEAPVADPPGAIEVDAEVEIEIEAVTMAVSDEVEPVDTPVRRPSIPRAPRVDASTRGGEDKESERGLRGLIGGGSSQVSVTAALRARDSARPTDEEMAHAAATTVIVHRGWIPRDSG